MITQIYIKTFAFVLNFYKKVQLIMSNTVTEIKNYILFLKKECRLEITLHPQEREQLISGSELALFNIHENPYCVYVKTFPAAFEHCVKRQKKIVEKCRGGSFCGTCYAGVKEFVYPIYDTLTVVGFISVSGYRDEKYISYTGRCSEKFSMPADDLRKTLANLKSELPDKEYVDTLINPLVRMLELAYSKVNDNASDNGYNLVLEIIKFVNRHYTENITLEQICSVFSRSRSCISHTFKKETGKSFREYLINVRLQSAKSLLRNSGLSVSEIAFSVGFNDSNYFSNTFKAHTGMSPGMYRKKQ